MFDVGLYVFLSIVLRTMTPSGEATVSKSLKKKMWSKVVRSHREIRYVITVNIFSLHVIQKHITKNALL